MNVSLTPREERAEKLRYASPQKMARMWSTLLERGTWRVQEAFVEAAQDAGWTYVPFEGWTRDAS